MKSFNEIYENIYRKCQGTLEETRKSALTGNIIVFTIVGILSIILTFKFINGFFLVCGIFIMVLYNCLGNKNRQYKTMFKENVIAEFVKEYSSNLNYLPNRGISRMIYNEGEFEHYDDFYSEDCITGTLEDGSTINMAEVKTQREYKDKDGDTSHETIFHGLFAEVKLQKIINTNMKIRKNKLLFGGGKEKIEMDSGEFEKIFDIYSTDKIIALQLLTADVMQMFIDFKEKNKITPEITIKADKMYIRFKTGEVFEANILKGALDFDTLLKYYNIINFTLELTEKILKNIKETEL